MIDHAHDLATVFYCPEVAHPFIRRRNGVADLLVMVIFGLEDVDVLDDRARAAQRAGRFVAGQDVRVGDQLIAQADVEPGLLAGSALTVLEPPRRVVDGREMEALLGSVPV